MTPGFRSYPSVIKPSPSLQANNYLWSLVEFKKKQPNKTNKILLVWGGGERSIHPQREWVQGDLCDGFSELTTRLIIGRCWLELKFYTSDPKYLMLLNIHT